MRIKRQLRAFTVAEMLIVLFLFSILSMVLLATLQEVSRIWYRTSARDDAIRQVLKARTRLVRDLANSSQVSGQYATAKVGPHLGTGFDGDALTFLTPDDGTHSQNWAADPSTGQAKLVNEITYYLVIPSAANKYGITPSAGPPDSQGYEQQSPFKWLVRRVDPVAPGTTVVNPVWSTTSGWILQPTAPIDTPAFQVVADQLFQFRVLNSAPVWALQISAVSVSDAVREIAVGTVPLAQTGYNLVEQLSVPARN